MKTLCVAFTLLTCTAVGVGAEPVPPQPNTWIGARIDFDTTLKEYLGDKSGRWVQTDGYSDSVYRPTQHSVLMRSGIRSEALGFSPGFYTNATIEWDLQSDTAKVIEVANWGGGSYGAGRLLPAYKEHRTPSPRHTYDGVCYVPEEDCMYQLLGAFGRMRGKNASEQAIAELEQDGRRTRAFSFKTKRWECIEDGVWKLFKTSPYECHLTHWADGRKLLFLNDNGDKHAQFDLTTRKWAEVKTTNKSPFRLYNARSTWDNKRSLWVFRLGPQLCTFNPKTTTFTALPNCYDDPTSVAAESRKKPYPRSAAKGVCYLSTHDCYLVCGPTGNDTCVYSPKSNTWTSIAGGHIKLPNGYLHYDPKLDIVVMNYQLQCFKFKYKPN